MNKLIYFILCHLGIHDYYLCGYHDFWEILGCRRCRITKYVERRR
jgi:hypothetical protein